MKILFTLILWHFWIPFDKTSYQQNAESIRTSFNIVICSKIILKFDEVPTTDCLPVYGIFVVHRFLQYLFHIQIRNSRELEKSIPQYTVFCHFRVELWIAHD